MKKVWKILIAILAILVILFLVNLIRNYTILKGIYSTNEKIIENHSNYYFKKSIFSEDLKEVELVVEDYHKDNLYLRKTEFEDSQNILLYNSDTKEVHRDDISMEKDIADEPLIVTLESNYQPALLSSYIDLKMLLLKYLLKPITYENDNYVIEIDDSKHLINKETKMVIEYTPGSNTRKTSI